MFRYLDREKTTAGDSTVYKYHWGARAEEEVDKRELLRFTAEVGGHGCAKPAGPLNSSPPSSAVRRGLSLVGDAVQGRH